MAFDTVRSRGRTGRLVGAVFAVLVLAGCGGDPNVVPDSFTPTTSGYQLGSGDRLRITVYGQPELSGEYQVDGSGNVSFPLIGAVEAGQATADQLEQRIAQKLKPDYLKDPNVSVEVLNFRPFYIVGEVKQPGSYAYVDGMTVINAVALAGGFTYRAREDNFYITRASDAERQKRGANQLTPVMPGDVITVRERYF